MRLFEYIKKCKNEIGWDDEAEKEYQSLKEIVERLKHETESTQWLVDEGDPFTMTREDYLENLEHILGNTTKGEKILHDNCWWRKSMTLILLRGGENE